MKEVQTYSEFTRNSSFKSKIRIKARNFIIAVRSIGTNITSTTNWIRMIYYHHVFDDEKKDFERQLKYLKGIGEFISIDTVLEMAHGGTPINGRYFCISFDDGFQNTYSNMMEITTRLHIPVIIYLPTDFINKDPMELNFDEVKDRMAPGSSLLLRFLSWDQCREMLSYDITFGSHGTSHQLLSSLNHNEVKHELQESKRVIEQELGVPCIHFAIPRGRIGRDFDPEITKQLAIETGYKTVVTTHRGIIQKGDDPYLLNREHLLAGWGNHQSRFFFGNNYPGNKY